MEQIGNYTILSKIGQGSFGAVFKAKDNSGNLYAVKKLSKSRQGSTMQMIENELKLLQSLKHPNLISALEIIRTPSYIYIISEYCGGGDLEAFINNSGQVPAELAKKWFKSIVEALSYLRTQRIIHRDIKLANILLTSRNSESAQVKICDFGFSKNLGKFSLTSTKLGTPTYMAPEIFEGKNYSFKVDVWSLGLLLYEMLYGNSPFNCSNLAQLLSVQKKPIKFPASDNVSQSAIDLIKLMCQVLPDNRPDYSRILQSSFFEIQEKPINLSSEVDYSLIVIDSSPRSSPDLKIEKVSNVPNSYDLPVDPNNIEEEKYPVNHVEKKEELKISENFVLEKEQLIIRIKLREIKLSECNEAVKPLFDNDQFYYIFNLYALNNYQMSLNSIKNFMEKYPGYEVSEINPYCSAYEFLINEINQNLSQAWIEEYLNEEIFVETIIDLAQKHFSDKTMAKAITGVGNHLYPSNETIYNLYLVCLN